MKNIVPHARQQGSKLGRSAMVLRGISLGVVTASLWFGTGHAQQVAGSVESGLQSLAQDIVAKTGSQQQTRIAILPFPNGDGSCSVLSTYLADELTQALATTQPSTLNIVERTQLEAILNEVQTGAAGILNPETTQSLGRISGVKALTVGTITQIGDRVRINARLVATDTGSLIAAAAVSIPRTSDVDSLLRQPVPGEGGVCGIRMNARPTAGATMASSAPPTVGGTTPPPPPSSATLEGLTFTAQTVSLSPDKKALSIVLRVVNAGKAPVRAQFVNPRPSVFDSTAVSAQASEINGIQVCTLFGKQFNEQNPEFCSNTPRRGWTTLSPNFPLTVLLRFQSEKTFSGNTFSFASSLMMEEDNEQNNQSTPESHKIKALTISLANLPLGGSR